MKMNRAILVAARQRSEIRDSGINRKQATWRAACRAAACVALLFAVAGGAQADITTDLVGWWKMDETSGTTAADSSDNATLHDGTLQATVPTWEAGKIGNALDFTPAASGGHVELANNGFSLGSGSFTIAAWIKPDDTPNKIRAIFGTTTPGGAAFWQANGKLAIAKKNSWESASVAAGIVTGAWQHVAVTVLSTSSTITFYVNGVAYAEANPAESSSAFTDKTDRIGRHGNVADEMFDGMIDDARIYNRALSSNDVMELYNYTGASAPTVSNDGGATNVTQTTACLNGSVTSTGGAPTTAYIYWGASDGGTSAASWANSVNMGIQSGSFTTTVTGLTVNTTYYYRCYATNSEGSAWAPTSTNFTTQILNGPVFRIW